MRARAFLAAALVCASSVASAAPRRALLVGNREGSPDQATLRYTSDDVRRLASVLTDLGGAETSALEDARADQVTAKLDALASGERSELFVFYYSGHADGANLSLGTTSLPLATLLAKVAAVPADLRVVVLDACQSGAATRAKGVTELAVGFGTQTYSGLETPQQSGGVLVSALTGVRLGGVFIRGGPLAGVEIISQQPEGRDARTAFAFRVGPRLRIDTALSRNIGLYSVFDVDLLVSSVEGRQGDLATSAGNVGFFGTASYGIGLVNAW